MSPVAHDEAFDRALGFDHVAAALSTSEIGRLDAYRRERRTWEAVVPLVALASATFPKGVFRGDWSPAFSRVAEVTVEAIGAQPRHPARRAWRAAPSGLQRRAPEAVVLRAAGASWYPLAILGP